MRLTHERIKKNFHNDKKKTIKFAKIDSGYVSGRPQLIFDGETITTLKQYPYIATYTPVANDRVMVIHGVVMGAIL